MDWCGNETSILALRFMLHTDEQQSRDLYSLHVAVFILLSGLPPNETTFAEVAQQHGYSTGLIGQQSVSVFTMSSDILSDRQANYA
jgi:hypothetical protein